MHRDFTACERVGFQAMSGISIVFYVDEVFMKKYVIPIILLASSMSLVACSDDDKNENEGDPSVRSIDKWIGSPCSCEGSGCQALGIPLPTPTEGKGTIKGCDNVDLAGIEGAKLVCLQTIDASKFEALAPPTYFPEGYCAISAVGCEYADEVNENGEPKKTNMCGTAAYGEVGSFTKCPTGSVMIESVFNYGIVGSKSVITNKTCAKACNSDKDCNESGEMSCLDRNGVKFCYNESNFEFMGDTIKFTKF